MSRRENKRDFCLSLGAKAFLDFSHEDLGQNVVALTSSLGGTHRRLLGRSRDQLQPGSYIVEC